VRRGRLRSPPVRPDAGRIPLCPAIHVQEPGPSVPRSIQGNFFVCFFSCVHMYVGANNAAFNHQISISNATYKVTQLPS
jgi:hypothetical protein